MGSSSMKIEGGGGRGGHNFLLPHNGYFAQCEEAKRVSINFEP